MLSRAISFQMFYLLVFTRFRGVISHRLFWGKDNFDIKQALQLCFTEDATLNDKHIHRAIRGTNKCRLSAGDPRQRPSTKEFLRTYMYI